MRRTSYEVLKPKRVNGEGCAGQFSIVAMKKNVTVLRLLFSKGPPHQAASGRSKTLPMSSQVGRVPHPENPHPTDVYC